MEQHQDKAEMALKYAKSLGANEASVGFAVGEGFSVTARNRAIESVEDYKDQSFSVTVYLDKSVGSASSNNLSESAIFNSSADDPHLNFIIADCPPIGFAEPCKS